MAKYNKKTVAATKIVAAMTHQGGAGYQLKPELELMSLLANGINNTFYEKESTQEKRLTDLITKVCKQDKLLVAKMLVYTRSVLGQRSVTHAASVALLPHISGVEWAKNLFTKRDRKENFGGLIYRLDDMLEIAARYMDVNPGKRLPNSVTKGFKSVLEEADTYELAKYQGKTRGVSLVDIINLVHPKPRKEMVKAFKALINGELKQFNTVEDKNTKSGQEVAQKVAQGVLTVDEAATELAKAKEKNYKELVEEKVIGYLALLRNLRNILTNSSDSTLLKATVDQLTDEKAIRKSLVFPHQIDLALEVLMAEFGNSKVGVIAKALNTAYELAIPNLSELGMTGRTAVVLDRSGSMTSKIHLANGYGSAAAIEKGALIAATLAKGLGADIYVFGDRCFEHKYNVNDSVNTIKHTLSNPANEGTQFYTIFPALKERYDRVFIVSDMQGADSIGDTLRTYKSQYSVDPYIYCINLCGYGTTMFKENKKVAQISGYSAEIYELVKKMEIDINAVLNEVKKINFLPKNVDTTIKAVTKKKISKRVGGVKKK